MRLRELEETRQQGIVPPMFAEIFPALIKEPGILPVSSNTRINTFEIFRS